MIKLGIVGTGYAAKKRAEAILDETRGKIIGVSGHNHQTTAEFAQKFQTEKLESWQKLINHPEIDLVFICTVNRDHGAIAEAALEANKHVVVEYPLSLNPKQGQHLIQLAQSRGKLLHIEHIEILGGIHQTIRKYLPQLGNIFFARYATVSAQQNVAGKWSYDHQLFGFPLSAALSRIHRLTDLFGRVDRVSSQTRYWDIPNTTQFTACLSQAQLQFSNGVIAQLTYGKGEVFHQSYRVMEISGDRATLVFEGQKGMLYQNNTSTEIGIANLHGLFAQDTKMVLDYLTTGKPLYVDASASCYALEVADAACQSSALNQTIKLD